MYHPRHLPDQGIVLVTGSQGSGKTYMSLFLALMKRTGTARPLVHISSTQPMPMDPNDPYPLFHSSFDSMPYPLPAQAIVLIDDVSSVQQVATEIVETNGILYIVACSDANVPPEWLTWIDAVCLMKTDTPALYYSQWLHRWFEHESAALDVVRLVTHHPKNHCALMVTPQGIGNLRADMNLFTFERV